VQPWYGLGAGKVVNTIYGHPTYSEALAEAFANVPGEAIHVPKKK
jgi:dihydrolipoamide dehydrogenase